MAKRKRLTPAQPQPADLAEEAVQGSRTGPALGAGLGQGARPPISQVAGDAAAVAALEGLAAEVRQARAAGLLIQQVPLDAVETDYIVRDRILADDEDMQALMQSLRSRGQQTPVELVELGEGRFGLISGWRRLTALRRLREETGAPRFGVVLAVLRRPVDAAAAYEAMIEENEIRVGLSYYERARIAAKAVEQGIYDDEKQALLALFASASRAKRSKIRSFLAIYHVLDESLCFPGRIPERLGLKLSKALEETPALARRIEAELRRSVPADAEAEQRLLSEMIEAAELPAEPPETGPEQSRAAAAAKRGAAGKKEAASVLPGVRLEWSKGRLILSGPSVTRTLEDRLKTWLKGQGD